MRIWRGPWSFGISGDLAVCHPRIYVPVHKVTSTGSRNGKFSSAENRHVFSFCAAPADGGQQFVIGDWTANI